MCLAKKLLFFFLWLLVVVLFELGVRAPNHTAMSEELLLQQRLEAAEAATAAAEEKISRIIALVKRSKADEEAVSGLPHARHLASHLSVPHARFLNLLLAC